MTKPTIEELESMRFIQKDLQSLQDQISHLYYPVSSPPMVSDGSQYGGLPGDPTARAVSSIDRLNRLMCEKVEELSSTIEKVENWLESLSDGEFCSMVRWHYMQGLSWPKTARKIYGYDCGDNVRKKFRNIYDKL